MGWFLKGVDWLQSFFFKLVCLGGIWKALQRWNAGRLARLQFCNLAKSVCNSRWIVGALAMYPWRQTCWSSGLECLAVLELRQVGKVILLARSAVLQTCLGSEFKSFAVLELWQAGKVALAH